MARIGRGGQRIGVMAYGGGSCSCRSQRRNGVIISRRLAAYSAKRILAQWRRKLMPKTGGGVAIANLQLWPSKNHRMA